MKSLSIIVVTYQSSDVLPALLDSLRQQDCSSDEYELIVVDNASNDLTVAIVEERFPKARVVKNAENKGFAVAANHGGKMAGGKYLLFLNPDTVLEKGFVRSCCRAFETDPTIGIAGPRLVSPDGNLQPSCWKAPSWQTLLAEAFFSHRMATQLVTVQPDRNMIVRGVSGACLLTRKDVFERVGGFDERFFMYYEDLDYCRRGEAEGFRVVYLHEHTTVHILASSSHKDPDAFFTTYHRSRLLFYQKYLSPPSFVKGVIRSGLFLRVLAYSILGLFLPRFSVLARAHRRALQSLPG